MGMEDPELTPVAGLPPPIRPNQEELLEAAKRLRKLLSNASNHLNHALAGLSLDRHPRGDCTGFGPHPCSTLFSCNVFEVNGGGQSTFEPDMLSTPIQYGVANFAAQNSTDAVNIPRQKHRLIIAGAEPLSKRSRRLVITGGSSRDSSLQGFTTDQVLEHETLQEEVTHFQGCGASSLFWETLPVAARSA